MFKKKITKLFIVDWLITLFMYISGYVISGLEASKSLDIVSLLSNTSSGSDQAYRTNFLGTSIYLFISLSFVVLISFLINKSYIKASKKEFVISQLIYFMSFTTVISLLTFLI